MNYKIQKFSIQKLIANIWLERQKTQTDPIHHIAYYLLPSREPGVSTEEQWIELETFLHDYINSEKLEATHTQLI